MSCVYHLAEMGWLVLSLLQFKTIDKGKVQQDKKKEGAQEILSLLIICNCPVCNLKREDNWDE